MERRVIDMEKDPRREQFQLFSGYAFPYAGVTVQLDVTPWSCGCGRSTSLSS